VPNDYVGADKEDITVMLRTQLQNMDGGQDMMIQALVPMAEDSIRHNDPRDDIGRAYFTLTPTTTGKSP